MSDGVLLLDKPVGISSFQALYPVKRVFRGRKIGHAGTLDPAASGLLVAGVGLGTRLLEFLEGMTKRYRFDIRLGVVTDTYDLEGEVLERRDFQGITARMVEEILPKFRGKISQLPPAYSAVKIQGRRACDRTRAGEIVEMHPRQVRIDRLELAEFAEGVATLEMDCSKGTYVRSIAHDIGRELGCGAAANNIRRLAVGPFRVEDAVAPDSVLGPGNLLPLEKAVEHLPALQIRSSFIAALLHGNSVPAAGYAPMSTPPRPAVGAPLMVAQPRGAEEEGNVYGIFSPEGKLLAVGAVTPMGMFNPRKVLPSA